MAVRNIFTASLLMDGALPFRHLNFSSTKRARRPPPCTKKENRLVRPGHGWRHF